MTGWIGIAANVLGIGINLANAYALRKIPGLSLVFVCYAVACIGYAYSVWKAM